MFDFTAGAVQAIADLSRAVAGTDPGAVSALAHEIATARRVALHGAGREGLMMRALAMRLAHLGRDAHVVGDMTMPPLGNGDLLVVSSGPGRSATIAALVEVARLAGVHTACVTAQAQGPVPRACDTVLVLPAQTMANDATPSSILPMGSLYEGAQFIVFELLVLRLRATLGETAKAMCARHTNLE